MHNLKDDNNEDLRQFLAINWQILSRLLTFIDFAAGLTIGFIEIDREQERDWIVDWLMNHPQCQDVQFLVLTYESPDLRFLLDEILKSLPHDLPTDKDLVLIIKGLEYSIGHTEYPPVLQNINFVRDAFVDAVPYPILFCLPSYQITSFANYAPDFWAWKSGLFKFESVEQEPIFSPSLPVEYSQSRKTPEPQSRIDLLERFLAGYTDSPDTNNESFLLSVLHQLGNAHHSRQEWQSAEDCLTQALYIAEENPSLLTVKINLLIELADVYQEQEKYNLAEEIYQKVLNQNRHRLSSQQLAKIQNGLGIIYARSPQGNVADNLENAIACFQSVLKIYTHEDYPLDWANTQNNLATAYRQWLRGNRAENLEKAIEHYQAALRVRTETDFPEHWAQTQNSLGIAYRQRIRGNRAENLEKAIEHYQAALRVRTKTDVPQHWAQTQSCLGFAYLNRIRGNREENLEKAIEHYQAALRIRTETDFPQNWARIQYDLGSAYTKRIKGEKAENIKRAIECYQNALNIYTPDTFPREWEQTQNLLQAISPDFSISDGEFALVEERKSS
jgi:tetratricopeptide (TPR) repeat protein